LLLSDHIKLELHLVQREIERQEGVELSTEMRRLFTARDQKERDGEWRRGRGEGADLMNLMSSWAATAWVTVAGLRKITSFNCSFSAKWRTRPAVWSARRSSSDCPSERPYSEHQTMYSLNMKLKKDRERKAERIGRHQ
jgi:hypothetical protein